ncbi:Tm-1-like ATP-binding domain-containing protein [Neptunicoccus sediminis]|uniref:Tm-1-like ATP-binding domain-containing protein n=1 Tax=Neptunicoccus sediminis TaxID=1892596 RepID=UPI0008460649|nr:Tm-1-like ATP-binding domain-containing protein [Neptunicoccus sediminis]
MSKLYLVGTFDTKSKELGYLATLLRRGVLPVVTVDLSTQKPAEAADVADVSAQAVAACHPEGADHVLGGSDRGAAVKAMAEAFARFCISRQNDISAMIGIGGGGGSAMVSEGMRALPYGLPKLLVTTLASGDMAPYIGSSDTIVIPSVTDLAGLNRLSRNILHNAAQALIGMTASPYLRPIVEKESLGLSMFGVTTPCVTQITAQMKPDYDCVVFHATGTGGRTLESLLDSGYLCGVMDMTLTEIADELVGGVLPSGPARLDAVCRARKPWVGAPGAVDMVNFWAPDTVPEKFADRLFYNHNANVTLMRTTPDENAQIGAWIAAKLNKCRGPVTLLIPEGGVSALDIKDGPFHHPEASAALFDTLDARFKQTAQRKLVRLPHHINDPAFSAAAVDAFQSLQQDP